MRRRALCCVVAIWMSSAGAAEEPSSADSSLRLSAVGQIVDPDGKPVAGARVVLREWAAARRSENMFLPEIRDVLAETTSDAEGKFQFESVDAKPFRGRRDSYPWDIIAIADGYGLTWIHLPAQESARPVTLKFHRPKAISGRLVNSATQPVADCEVEVANLSPPGSHWVSGYDAPRSLSLWHSQLAPTAITDASGRFKIDGLPADYRVEVVFHHPRYSHDAAFIATTDTPQPGIPYPGPSSDKAPETRPVYMPGFTHTLNPGGRIHGKVLYADTERPAAGARVRAGAALFSSVADAEGRFSLNSLLVSPHQVFASTSEPGYVATQQTVNCTLENLEHEVVLKLPRGEIVRGIVVDSETTAPVAGVGVIYVVSNNTDGSGSSPSKSTSTDSSGRFELVVPSGSGELRVYRTHIERHPTHDVPDYYRWQAKQSLSPDHSAKIEVMPGEVLDGVRLAVGRGMVIGGRVVDPQGETVFGAVVRLSDRFGRDGSENTTVTDDAGRFELSGFAPHEEYKIEVVDVDRQLRGAATVAADASIGPNRAVDLGNVQLKGTGTVVGTVLGDGKPLAGARVHLYKHVDHAGREEIEPLGRQTETDNEGRFRFDTVEADTRISAWVDRDGYTNQSTTSYALATSQELELPAIELKSRGSFVAGVVVDPDGKPVAGVTVSASARDRSSISFGRNGPPQPTDAVGRFRIDDLPNVPLELMAYIPPPAETKDRTIHFPARGNAEPGQTNVRIVLDPKLQRPLP